MLEYIERLMRFGYTREQAIAVCNNLGGWKAMPKIEGYLRALEIGRKVHGNVEAV